MYLMLHFTSSTKNTQYIFKYKTIIFYLQKWFFPLKVLFYYRILLLNALSLWARLKGFFMYYCSIDISIFFLFIILIFCFFFLSLLCGIRPVSLNRKLGPIVQLSCTQQNRIERVKVLKCFSFFFPSKMSFCWTDVAL